MLSPSKNCIELIKYFEGCKLEAYRDIGGIPTVGVGTILYASGIPVKMGDKLTMAEAEKELFFDLVNIVKDIENFSLKNSVCFSQSQLDATVSILYNCGSGLLGPRKSLGIALRSRDAVRVSDAFLVYCKLRRAGKLVISNGLLRRRKSESHLYLTGVIKTNWS